MVRHSRHGRGAPSRGQPLSDRHSADIGQCPFAVERAATLLGGEHAVLGPSCIRQEVQRQASHHVVRQRRGDPDVGIVGNAGRLEPCVDELANPRLLWY